jgi:hypothetical protein
MMITSTSDEAVDEWSDDNREQPEGCPQYQKNETQGQKLFHYMVQ